MFRFRPPLRLGLVVLLSGVLAVPARSDKFPGGSPGIGGAVAAKVIGQRCQNVLSVTEIGELDAYLQRAATESASQQKSQAGTGYRGLSHNDIVQSLTETYTAKYSDPKACDAGASEEAKDVLMKVRTILSSGKALFPVYGDPAYKPNVGEAITAKLTGEKCKDALTLLEWAELELYVARQWVWWVKNASESDARLTIELNKTAERDIANGWHPSACTGQAIQSAKQVATRVHEIERASQPN